MTSGIDMPYNPTTSSDLSWLLARCALGELSPEQQEHLEDRLLHDEQLCLELAGTVELLQTLRQTPATQTPASSHPLSATTPRRRNARTRTLSATATLAALAALALLLIAPGSGHPENLGDAVTLSSLLQSENHEQRSNDSDSWTSETDLPEPPDWLLTALDLDEQTSENAAPAVDDDDEALF
ncbi:MAG: hypothetical protein ACK5KS_06805 [Planctomyces sp.]|jgi:ferric-dicitrate binding protein FerR (iron transport regulator)